AVQEGVHRQARKALEEADVIVFVVDARDGVTPIDRDVAGLLRRLDKPILVVANKVDSAKQEAPAAESWELAPGEVVPGSASPGRGIAELLGALLAVLPPEPPPATAPEKAVRIAFVGRPNVGKSSLVNRLLGEDRVLVHDDPGTTTDPVDTPFEVAGKRYVLVDTAGIRRKARIEEPTENIAVSMALGQLERTDVAILVIDAAADPVDQDAKIAGAIEDAGRACAIALNKSDLLADAGDAAEKRLRREIADALPFVSFAPVRF